MKQSLTVTKLTHLLIVGALLIGVCPLIGTSTAQEESLRMTGDRAQLKPTRPSLASTRRSLIWESWSKQTR